MGKNILVTGSHRSGTTWVGKVISKGKSVRYIHEPFNIGIIRINSPLIYWFEHISDNSPVEHQRYVKEYINSFFEGFNIGALKILTILKFPKRTYRYLKDQVNSVLFRRSVIKDPIAVMSAEWLYKNFDFYTIVLIRHPAAFVASLKVKDWRFDFNNYLKQDVLINNYLKEYQTVINEYSNDSKDIIDQGILLWNTIHEVIAYYQSKFNNEWYFLKHEELSNNPIKEFENLFSMIDLRFSPKVKRYIDRTSTSKDKTEIVKLSTPVNNVNRDSKKNIKSWKKRLTDNDILRIKQGTEKVWKKFYTDDDW